MTRFDHIQNEDICDRYGVAPIVEKLRERRLRWYGHAIRANENSLAQIDVDIEVNDQKAGLNNGGLIRWMGICT